LSRRARVVGLLAAALVVAGAGGMLGLYQSLGGVFDRGFSVAWDRGHAFGVSQTVDGYRVTIDRAYSDGSRLMLAISVADELERPGTTQLMAMYAEVSDEAGRYMGAGVAESSPSGPFVAANILWLLPPEMPLPEGPRQVHVVVPHIFVRGDATPPPDSEESDWDPYRKKLGPWTFDIDVPVEGGGTVATPDAVAEVDGVSVSLSRIAISASGVRVELRVDGADPDAGWSAIGRVRHEFGEAPFQVGRRDAAGTIDVQTNGGFDDTSGAWTVEITELVGETEDGQVRLAGPWLLEFSLP
jgi:hypothetical protein